jgi:hypothetical protein
MPSNLDQYREALKKLVELGTQMSLDLSIRILEASGKLDKQHQELKEMKNKVKECFEKDYQKWYTESCALIRQIIPERLHEFESLYQADSRRRSIDIMTYTIQDWLMGVRAKPDILTGEKPFDDLTIVATRFETQRQLLESAESRFESKLFDIKQLVQADLFDSELDAARELHKGGFLRAAGVVAGVVLEAHLSQVCTNHGVTTRKKNPSLADYNDLLKKNDTVDVPTWRSIQRLGDLRNLCSHSKGRDPRTDEVSELIDGVEKIAKTLY